MESKPKELLEEVLFEAVVKDVHNLFDLWPDISEDNYFEGCILGCYIAIDRIKREKSVNSNNFEFKVFSVVESIAIGTSIHSRLPCRFSEFMEKRLKNYDEYYRSSEYSAKGTLALSKIAFQLYIVSLELEGQCEVSELLDFANNRIGTFFNAIHSSIDSILIDA